MSRCIQLAKNGLGTTSPNPLVGSVIVHNNIVIGEGWHYRSGMPHAEVNAINSVKNRQLLKKATIYVSLEPCSHFGKTPPCSDLIISSGIKKVVVGSVDSNPKVAGRGIKRLIEAGCDVVVGILAEECNELNKRFFTFHSKKRPYIILKWAQTSDGFIAPEDEKRSQEKKPFWITNEYSRQFIHKVRADEDAILVGTQTVLDDDPSLTTRDWHGTNPVRIVIDKELKIPKEASVFDGSTKTIVITEKEVSDRENVCVEKIHFSENIAQQICDILYSHSVQSVIIEGGSKTLQSFIDMNLWDEALVLQGNSIFEKGTKAPSIAVQNFSETLIKEDRLYSYLNKNT